VNNLSSYNSLIWSKAPRAVKSLIILGLFGLMLSTVWLHSYPANLSIDNISYSTVLRDRQGEILNVLLADDDRYRISTTVDDVDPTFVALLKSFEDKRFDQHKGVDWLALIRACQQLISNGRIVSGASTITMQVVRLLDPQPRSYWNKVDQIRKAIALEKQFTKSEIISLYLSLAPYGSNLEGITAASLGWFGKPPKQLTPAESALLVALPQSPENRRPDRNPLIAFQAREKVLSRALQKQIISYEYYEIAALSPVPTTIKSFPNDAIHLAWRLHFEGARNITSTIDAVLQYQSRQILSSAVLPPNSNAAILVTEASSGDVIAYIGSQDYFDIDRLGSIDYIRAIRSPGSTLKPFIYAIAESEQLVQPKTIIRDETIVIGNYMPQNYSKKTYGEVTIAEALQRSLNIPAVKVLHRMGPNKFKTKLFSAGINLRHGDGLPIALGGAGTTLEELVSLYSSLGNKGKVKANRYQYVETDQYDLLTEDTVRHINWILSNNSGSIGRLHGSIRTAPVAYKTGTGPGGSDSLAIGTNGKYVVGVWIGSPNGQYLPENTGITTALPIMSNVFDILPFGTLDVERPREPDYAFRYFDRELNNGQTSFSIIFPTEDSVVLRNEGIEQIPFITKDAHYPIVVSINNSDITTLDKPNDGIKLNAPGNYKLFAIDAKNSTAHLFFSIK